MNYDYGGLGVRDAKAYRRLYYQQKREKKELQQGIFIDRERGIRLEYYSPDDPIFVDASTPAAPTYWGEWTTDEAWDIINEIIESLHPMKKKVVRLHYLGGFNCREISKKLGVHKTTIWFILCVAISRLKEGVELFRKYDKRRP